jgi:hypothetical protein
MISRTDMMYSPDYILIVANPPLIAKGIAPESRVESC